MMPIVLLPVLTVAACSDKPAAAPGTSASAAAGAPGVASPEASAGPGNASAGPGSYAEMVQARLPQVAVDRRSDEIEAVAENSCASLAAGKGKDAVVAETRSLAATDPDMAKKLIRLAIQRVCPAQTNRLAEF